LRNNPRRLARGSCAGQDSNLLSVYLFSIKSMKTPLIAALLAMLMAWGVARSDR
jgi:hypothetical protein